MKRHVWILNHYAGHMLFDQGGRHYNFAKYLQKNGYEPVVFCCNAKHGKKERFFDCVQLWQEKMAEEIRTPFVYVNARTYAGNGKQRILNIVDFYRNVKKAAKEYAKQHGKPDVIYASSVHPLTLVAGIQLAKHFGVKCICEVRDLWPESIVAYSSRLTKTNPVVRLLYAGEKWIYKKADKLIFTMEGGYDYIVDQGWERMIPREKVFHINNGVDLEVFDRNREVFVVDDPDLDNPDVFKVIYAGSIRRVNNLGLLLNAAKKVTAPSVKFLIWGDGDERAALQQRLVDENIANVVFKGRVEKKYIPSVVSRADLNVVHNQPSSVDFYGLSLNKMFEYFASGRPSVFDFPSKYNAAITFEAGTDISEPTAVNIAAEIERYAEMSDEEYMAYCQNAKRAAKEYDFANLTKKLIDVIEK